MLGKLKLNLVHTRTQEKGAVTPQETDSDFPVSVHAYPAEAGPGQQWPVAGSGALGHYLHHGFPRSSVGKESACNAGHPGSIPGSGRSPGKRNGNPLQYSCPAAAQDRKSVV